MVVQRVHVPETLLACAPAPAVPAESVGYAAVGLFIVALEAARADCADALAKVRVFLAAVKL